MRRLGSGLSRSRWAAVGAAVAVAVGGGGLITSLAAGSPDASSFVPITPCRLMDTRLGVDNVGPRSTPIGDEEIHTPLVWGSNGECAIPASATAVSLNVTFVSPTEAGFVSVFPADQPWPGTSNLNFSPGQRATPNAVTSALSADGRLAFFNKNGTVHLVADIVGYYEPAQSGPRPAQVVWVATSGGDFTSVTAALTSITDNSISKPYLIRIAPGVFTEPGAIDLKDYVDIEGSGQGVTTITCACAGASPGATVRATGPGLHLELRELTVSTTGSGTFARGIHIFDVPAGRVSLRNATFTATGGTNNRGVFNVVSSPTMTNVTATATGGTSSIGVDNLGSSPTMTNVIATATGGTSSIGVSNGSSSLMMTNVTATATGGTTNRGVFNEFSSPKMTDVIATATGGTTNYGVNNLSSTPTMTGGSASASGGTADNTGVRNDGGSPVFQTVTVTGTGGTRGRGMENFAGASVTLVNVTATGSGGSTSQDWGIDNYDSATMTVRDSFITGTPKSILNNGSTVKVANSRLSVAASGTLTCINTYLSTTFALLGSGCT